MKNISVDAIAKNQSALHRLADWVMKRRPRLTGVTLQTRLIAAFLIVAVAPMLASTWFATRLVSKAFDANVRHWLNETTTLFINVIKEAQDDATATVGYLVNDGDLIDALVQGKETLPAKYRQLLTLFGYDFFGIVDENGKMAFASDPVDLINPSGLLTDHLLYEISRNGEKEILVAGSQTFQRNGKRYQVLLGVRLDNHFIAHTHLFTSLDIRIYYRDAAVYRQFYSSLGPVVTTRHSLPDNIVTELVDGASERFDANADHGEYRAVYAPIRAANGDLVGILFVGLRNRETLAGPMTQTRLFVGVLLIGSLLAIFAAVLLARRIATPLRSLAKAAEGIATGDYRRVERVSGHDEISDLTQAFNQMSDKLAQMQELEIQLRRRERLSALGQVALGIAHEVRNPLGIIRTSTELVQASSVLNASETKLLGYVIEETVRIDHLITEFLSFARPTPPDLRRIRILEVIERVAEFCKPHFAKFGIQVDIEATNPQIELLGDERLIYEALLNLILNAIDAMPEGGRLHLRNYSAYDGICIEVEDTGAGVPAEDIEHIFNPFFTTKARGTGLGLAKVFSVMEGHGGSIKYVAAAGGGAVFRLLFPFIL